MESRSARRGYHPHMPERPAHRSARLVGGWVTASVAVLATAATFVGMMFLNAGPCGGDGGESRAEEGSPREQACDVLLSGPQWMLLCGAPLALVWLGDWMAAHRQEDTYLVLALFAAALVPVVPHVVIALLSDG